MPLNFFPSPKDNFIIFKWLNKRFTFIKIMEQYLNVFSLDNLNFNPFSSLQRTSSQSTCRSFNCDQCTDVFKCAKGLQIHTNKIHSVGLKVHHCKICDKRFKSSILLKAHVKQVHEKACQILCTVCERYFSSKFILQSHKKRFHPAVASIN